MAKTDENFAQKQFELRLRFWVVLKVTSTDNSNDKCPVRVPIYAHKQCQETSPIWPNTRSPKTSLFACQPELAGRPICACTMSSQPDQIENKAQIDLLQTMLMSNVCLTRALGICAKSPNNCSRNCKLSSASISIPINICKKFKNDRLQRLD